MGRPRTDIEPRIVHAARERFLLEGVDGASLRDIAKDAGTSVGMIHYYFKTKDDLFLAVVEEVYARLLDDLSIAFTPDAPVRTRLSRAFRRLAEVSEHEQKVLRVVIREALVSSTRLDRLLARFRTGHLPLVFRALADGVASGEVDPDLPLPLVMAAIGGMAIVPQIMRRVAGEAPPFAGLPKGQDLAAITLDVLFRGIAPRPAPKVSRSAPPRSRARSRR